MSELLVVVVVLLIVVVGLQVAQLRRSVTVTVDATRRSHEACDVRPQTAFAAILSRSSLKRFFCGIKTKEEKMFSGRKASIQSNFSAKKRIFISALS